jgi:beta-glucosidase
MNKELNLSDAFVAAWLPGSEGAGVTDVLFGDVPFQGKLSYSWPAEDCQVPVNVGDDQTPLFSFGFGLTTDEDGTLALLAEETSDKGCDAPDITDAGTTNVPMDIFTNGNNQGDFVLRIGGPSNWSGVDVDVATEPATTELVGDLSATSVDGSVQYSAMRVDWQGNGQIYSQTTDPNIGQDLAPYANSETTLQFRVKVNSAPSTETVNLSMHCVYPCRGEVNIAPMLSSLALDEWNDIAIPLQCMINTGLDITNVNTAFLIWADDAALDISIEEVSWQPFTAGPSPDCTAFEPDAALQITETTEVYIDGITDASLFNPMGKWTANIDAGWAWAETFVTVTEIDEGAGDLAMDVQYGNEINHAGNVNFTPTEALDLTQMSKIEFDIKVISYGEASRIVGKMVCDGDPNACNTGDIDFSPAALDVWETKEIVFANYPSMDFTNVTTLIEVGGDWDAYPPLHNDIHFVVDNVRIVQ